MNDNEISPAMQAVIKQRGVTYTPPAAFTTSQPVQTSSAEIGKPVIGDRKVMDNEISPIMQKVIDERKKQKI